VAASAPGEELVDALVGNPENRCDVAHADPSSGESRGGLASSLDGETIGVSGLLAGLARLLDGPTGGLWQHGLGHELDVVLVGLEPQGGGLADAGEGLLDGLAQV